MKTKEEKRAAFIIEAWGELVYHRFKHMIDSDGYYKVDKEKGKMTKDLPEIQMLVEFIRPVEFRSDSFDFRPEKIGLFDKNNGWNLIHEGFPKETIYCELCINRVNTGHIYKFKKSDNMFYSDNVPFNSSRITHWKEIKFSDKPFF